LDRFIGGTTLIGIFDAEDEDTLLLAGKEPVEKRRANTADVEKAGWAWRESDSDLTQDFILYNYRNGRYL